MAKRRSRHTPTAERDDDFPSLTEPVVRPSPKFVASRPLVAKQSPDLRPVEDRRAYDPSGIYRSARKRSGAQATIKLRTPQRSQALKASYPSYQIGFSQPKQVIVCVRRKIRKEVMIAKRKTRRAGVKGRRNYWSDIQC